MICVNDLAEPKIKFLGVHIDPFLTFKDHIQHLNSNLTTGLFFLRCVKNVLNEKALKSLYYSLIHCHIIYAIHVYSSAADGLLKTIFKKQKVALRIITNSQYNAHTEPLLKKLRILQFPQLCDFFKIQFMHSFKQEFLPTSFNETWQTNRIRRNDLAEIELRNDDLLAIPFARTKFCERLPLTSFPKIWTNFPSEEIKFIRNKIEFNEKFKKLLS